MTRRRDRGVTVGDAAPAPTHGPAGAGIVLDHVQKHFFHNGRPVVALRDVSLSVTAGEFVSVIGPSGCGKSTLLRIIGGLIAPDGGSVRIDDATPDEARAAKRFGLVPQTPALLPWRSVVENVTLLRDVGRPPWPLRAGSRVAIPDDPTRDPMALLEQVGLAPFAKSLPKELSGGMQQRVSLVRAFALGAPILLMDEPFAALDEITRDTMRYQLLDVWSETRTTVVFVTHSIAEAVVLSDRVITMAARPGRVAAVEQIELARPRTEDMEDSDQFTLHAHRVRTSLRASWEGRRP
ncbi:MAG: ABC transporter ATP-binding protein [Acidimicrobiales bacterium]